MQVNLAVSIVGEIILMGGMLLICGEVHGDELPELLVVIFNASNGLTDKRL